MLTLAAGLGAFGAPPAAAAGSDGSLACAFDPASGTVDVTGNAHTVYIAVVGDSGMAGDPGPARITVGDRYGAGHDIACGPVEPAPASVDRIVVRVSGSTLVTIADPASFGPGLTPEKDGSSEIEFDVDLGPGGTDGLAFEPEVVDWICCHIWFRRPLDLRVDRRSVDFRPAARGGSERDLEFAGLERIEVGVEGADYVDAVRLAGARQGGALSIVADGGGARDDLRGGAGADELNGSWNDDRVRGGRGADILDGGEGEDVVRGGNGADRLLEGWDADVLLGGPGRDLIDARDGVADDLIDCGPGKDPPALVDDVDPEPVSC